MSDQSNIFERGFADAAGLTDPTRDNDAIDATMYELYKAGAAGSTTSKLKIYMGGVWVAKPLKKYVGGMWVEYPLKYLSSEQKARITILQSPYGKPLRSADGKLLIRGDWPPDYYLPKNGLLYNWPAVADSRNIAAEGWHIISWYNEYVDLISYLGGSSVAGGKMKETGFTFWNSPNTGATNEAGFNARGSGRRTTVGFADLKDQGCIWSTTYNFYLLLTANSSSAVYVGNQSEKNGHSIRVVKDETNLSDGETGIYTGNDGKIYRTICINGAEYLADNLCETKFRNGDTIPWHGANPANYFTNAEWAALTTPGVCAYDNLLSNVGPGFSFPS